MKKKLFFNIAEFTQKTHAISRFLAKIIQVPISRNLPIFGKKLSAMPPPLLLVSNFFLKIFIFLPTVFYEKLIIFRNDYLLKWRKARQ
jgi:hypothetical protein